MLSTILEKQQSIVVDITYVCNATCRYCRWGDAKTFGRTACSLEDILISSETLQNFGTKRIVLSGGEPRLHPEIKQILHYYHDLVDQVVVITNGYGLTKTEAKKLLDYGATGFTISLDSINSMESFLTRSTLPHIHKKILESIEDICTMPHDFECGINSVVSHITANWMTVKELLEFGRGVEIDFVKFQPIFDDGYASKNAPELLLSSEDVTYLLEIAAKIDTLDKPLTNTVEFWRDVAALAGGKTLPAKGCGLDSAHAMSVKGKLGMCYWIPSQYGSTSDIIDEENLLKVQTEFDGKKQSCSVDFHCFCNQGINHKWSV